MSFFGAQRFQKRADVCRWDDTRMGCLRASCRFLHPSRVNRVPVDTRTEQQKKRDEEAASLSGEALDARKLEWAAEDVAEMKRAEEAAAARLEDEKRRAEIQKNKNILMNVQQKLRDQMEKIGEERSSSGDFEMWKHALRCASHFGYVVSVRIRRTAHKPHQATNMSGGETSSDDEDESGVVYPYLPYWTEDDEKLVGVLTTLPEMFWKVYIRGLLEENVGSVTKSMTLSADESSASPYSDAAGYGYLPFSGEHYMIRYHNEKIFIDGMWLTKIPAGSPISTMLDWLRTRAC